MSEVQGAQLLARGVQDVWLSGDPQVSFFRSRFKRHVPFATTVERFLVPLDGKIVLSPKSDLLGYTYLTAHDPTTGALAPNADWSNIISTVELVISNQSIATHDLTYINTIQKVLESDTYSKRSSTPFQPLGFFFDRQALPIAALKYTGIEINITWTSTAMASQYVYRCWSHCVHLGEEEREFFATHNHQMIIPQLQRIIIQKDVPFHGPIKYIAAPCINYLYDVYKPPLYQFNGFTFTTLNGDYQTGPTSLSGYGTNYPGYGTPYALVLGTGTSAGMQRWTVPYTRLYTFMVAGAGNSKSLLTQPTNSNYIYTSYGAVVTITLPLTVGHVLRLLVGQQGAQTTGQFSRGGGNGGTFVYNETTSSLLIAAGGAGGSASDISSGTGGNGSNISPYTDGTGRGLNGNTAVSGNGLNGRSALFGTGGTSGNGGGANTQGYGGQGGGGYIGNGLVNPANGETSTAALSFINGGTGGIGGVSSGGFGGGGTGGSVGGAGSGGGGGYSGGGGGANLGNGEGGGGGGSWSSVAWSQITTTNAGQGYITISS